VEELNSETLPEGVRSHAFLDRTELVNTTLLTVSRTLLEGMLLVIIVLIIFLGSWRGALLVAVTIPLSLLFAFIMMHLTKIPANLLSLGAYRSCKANIFCHTYYHHCISPNVRL